MARKSGSCRRREHVREECFEPFDKRVGSEYPVDVDHDPTELCCLRADRLRQQCVALDDVPAPVRLAPEQELALELERGNEKDRLRADQLREKLRPFGHDRLRDRKGGEILEHESNCSRA